MAFVSMSVEKGLLRQQKSNYQLEVIIASENSNNMNEQVTALTQEDEDNGNSANQDMIRELAAYQKDFECELASCNDSLQAINTELDSYNSAITNDIKSECKFQV